MSDHREDFSQAIAELPEELRLAGQQVVDALLAETDAVERNQSVIDATQKLIDTARVAANDILYLTSPLFSVHEFILLAVIDEYLYESHMPSPGELPLYDEFLATSLIQMVEPFEKLSEILPHEVKAIMDLINKWPELRDGKQKMTPEQRLYLAERLEFHRKK